MIKCQTETLASVGCSVATIGRHLGSLLLYTVLVSYPIQLSSRHTVGHPKGSCDSWMDGRPGLGTLTMLLDILRSDGTFMNSRWQY